MAVFSKIEDVMPELLEKMRSSLSRISIEEGIHFNEQVLDVWWWQSLSSLLL